MPYFLSYRTDRPDRVADIVVVDRSATTHGREITTRRWLQHEAAVLAARSVYLTNLEVASCSGVPQ